MTNIHQNKSVRAHKIKITCFDEALNEEVPIGYAQSLEIKIPNATAFIEGLGSDKPLEIVEGIPKPTGTIDEVIINTNLINRTQRNDDGELPYLSFTGIVKIGGINKTINVSGAKLDGLTLKFDLTAAGSLKGSFSFKALSIEVI